ncbi:TIGR01440 family protein [Virgibacillus sp. NKC19-16]|uniref:TIGR01440 family protein n=1 Tax=Virgibacillus salidurans TaxID=2831673 RepID=UPI001F2B6111|nr:TIGR01440 family protein [Virgibacillus sp. NKC19-16]UJL45991.1 TIGR01440 family protein [Virgibacillus sp. NKC19-16]
MVDANRNARQDIERVVDEWVSGDYLKVGDLFVIGCSTSEVIGKNIGTSGSEEVASILFDAMKKLQQQTGVNLVFQACEHINRALVMEKEISQKYQLEEVSVIPVPKAGGSMASYAYKNMENPVVVETVKADAGIDIGETMIGMQLKHVAVPLRFNQRFIGNARVASARTRPKLIGGVRANYENSNS